MKKKVSGQVQVYSRKAREQIVSIGEFIFADAGVSHVFNEVYSCVDELIKNAVKANYKFVLVMDHMEKNIRRNNPSMSREEVLQQLDMSVRDRLNYDAEAEKIIQDEQLSAFVRETLNEEAVQIRVKNKVVEQKRDYTEDEITKLRNLKKINMMRYELFKRNVKVIVSYEIDEDFIYVEVTNTSPILAVDLKRIYAKRDEFRTYREDGRQQDFFLNNLDTSESGFGLGYATIDSYLGDIGLDTSVAVQIIAASDTTVILSLPLSVLKSGKAS